MVVVKLIGGLGNQMFQYATAKAIAQKRKQKLYLDTSAFKNYSLHNYDLHHFNIKAGSFKSPPKWLKKITNKIGLNKYYKESSFRYDASLWDNKTKNVFLSGYFQSEKYFKKYRKVILNDFKTISPLSPETVSLLNEISKVNAISIHIRRGDFLKHDVHNTSKEEYYERAMQFIESKVDNPIYYCFSDDMDWVKTNFKTNFKTIYVDFNTASTAYQDMLLMSRCKHNIIANSSFSWWAAWLNTSEDKFVCAPKKWFNGSTYDFTDVIPNTWITF
ncbi:alpha-1,2-fucosyltransferase [Hyunsoonleella ulvae]|uniref:alpha-1,2-fucosyltransferase n=1 Tax=Hyunsoonleella ulvae TaxID=2799948 RepID=UPI001939661B|nr:alpha-1,2-fucosyltransferase [Hyunsoonleella ulvae]